MELITPKKLPPKYDTQSLLTSLRDPLRLLTHSPENYPDIFRYRLLQRKIYIINSPDFARYVLQENFTNYQKGEAYKVVGLLLGNGLLNSEGDFWRRQRRLAQPAFHTQSLQRVCDIVNDSTINMLQRWKKMEGQVINFTREMAGLTIEIVAKALFTADAAEEDINTIWHSVNSLNEIAFQMVRNPLALPFWMPLPSYNRARQGIARLDELVYRIINKRKTASSFSPDLLQLLLESRDEETGEQMNEQQLRDEVMTIYLAGHETTVNALSWTWYLLGKHPEEEKRLRKEADLACTGPIRFEQLPSLKFCKQVVNESLRLYPPASGVGRKLINEDNIGGYYVPVDTRVLINITGIHHHPRYWSDPWKFLPDRFENSDLKGDNRFRFMPFGGGPRICIGNNFAMMEMQIINALLAKHVELELLSGDIKPVQQITLKPGNGVQFRIKKVRD
jgi:cytochrome P450